MGDIFDIFKSLGLNSTPSTSKPEFIVVGLGNPGKEYENTRHNAGFMVLDYIADRCGISVRDAKFKALTGVGKIGESTVLLMKPQTYMNNSGEAVVEAANFYRIPTENIIVISDDIAQAPGRIRVRKSGSAGGQKGLLSIINHLSAQSFPRIRIGVGEKPSPEYDLAAWVLGKFPEADKKSVEARFGDIYEGLKLMLDGKYDDAMGLCNKK